MSGINLEDLNKTRLDCLNKMKSIRYLAKTVFMYIPILIP